MLAFLLQVSLFVAGAGPTRHTVPRHCIRDLPSEASEPLIAESAIASDTQTIVGRLENRYHSAVSLKATFLERYSETLHAARVESGSVYFKRPGRMRWEYEAPEEKLFIADGKIVWFYVPADRTVTRARMKESTDWRTPLALLTGKAKLSRVCGRIEQVDGVAAGANMPAGHVMLRCLPRGEPARKVKEGTAQDATPIAAEGSFHEVLLEVDAGSGELARVLIRQTGGVEIEFRFGNWQHDPALPDSMFHFQAPPGVTIVDESSITGQSR